ncbi:hypothetical protein PoB_007661500 [Plakobranchus ocellatus]|uniref:Uncharacterized protein n=1 Tax=Plakobranchus ocellatus TaxID=259542 RepID=A0AAV4E125_9GAST|nr:hypothetical protein PoB_007661500 [Plakobranchus ocellatus]
MAPKFALSSQDPGAIQTFQKLLWGNASFVYTLGKESHSNGAEDRVTKAENVGGMDNGGTLYTSIFSISAVLSSGHPWSSTSFTPFSYILPQNDHPVKRKAVR